jgi:FKBP-type peptidyl-prolyl cis-trans isomerase
VIPPNSPLVFDVALQAVWPRPELADAPAEVADYETKESGLQYAVLADGESDGAVANNGDRVHVHYTGWLEDGTMFDSSLKAERCEPIAFPLGAGQVIRGWDEGVEGMVVGEKRQLRISPDLGYGASGSGSGSIPPNSTLIFDAQLVGVDKPFAPQ